MFKGLKMIVIVAIIVLAASFGSGLYIGNLNKRAIEAKIKSNPTVRIETNGITSSQQEEDRLLVEERIKAEERRLKDEEEAKKKLEEARIKAEKEANEQLSSKQQAQKVIPAQNKQTTTSSNLQNIKSTEDIVKKSASSIRQEIPMKYAFEYLEKVEEQVVALCNQERAKIGIKPLLLNETLRQSSRYKSNEMLQYNYFDHKSPVTGYNPWDLAKTFGYSYTRFGENIWYGSGYSREGVSAKAIVDAWMNSQGHRSNILNKDFGRIGVGIVFSGVNKKVEATQQFSN